MSGDAAQVSWWELDTWTEPLNQFARGTGLSVAIYDCAGRRLIGPLFHQPLAQLIAATGAFEPDGACARFERELVIRAAERGEPARGQFENGLEVRARPAISGETVCGVIVYGWVFTQFPDPVLCERIARRTGIPSNRFWAAARQHLPISDDKLAVYEGLLVSLSAALLGQLAARQVMVDASNLKDQFLSTLSHELRTPLTSVQLRLQSLGRSLVTDDPRIRGILDAMARGLKSQQRLIEELLDTSRVLTGKMKLELERVNLGSVLRSSIETVSPMAQAKGVTVSVSIPELSRDMQGDPERLQQLFWNLLSNAVKFTPSGGTVWVTLEEKLEGFEVTVRDNGQGIDAAQIPLVFVRFYQAPALVSSSQKGIGLGLSLARHIADLHGGTITAASDGKDKGATFVVRLPASSAPH